MSTSSLDCEVTVQHCSSASSMLNASATTASPLRGVRLFRSISRRLAGRRSPADSDLSISSSSSASSSSGSSDSVFSLAPHLSASSWSSASSLGGSTSSDSCSESTAFKVKVKRVLTTLGSGFATRESGKKVAPKSILRAPTTTMFVRGMSGLPRRVPANCCRGEVTLFSR